MIHLSYLAIFFILIYLILYCIIPNIWLRNFSKTVLRRGVRTEAIVSITFDDGPNIEYTPKVLNILKAYGVKASFFVIAKNAIKYPDLIRQILDEGHTLGIHTYAHNHAWLMLPNMVYQDLSATCSVIQNITGKRPVWFRPPWGTFNLSIPFAALRHKLRIAHYSISAQDWRRNRTTEAIVDVVSRKAEPGSIILLHDNGTRIANLSRMLKALPLIISTIENLGYTFVTLDELGVDSYDKNNR